MNQQGAQCVNQDQRQLVMQTDGSELQRLWGNQFQDSSLSPALPLMHAHSQADHTFTEYSLFQQSDHEFAPLRPYPDISMASERFHLPAHDHTTNASQCASLSQYPLAQTTILSEEEAISCCSLSQHSLSPGDPGRQKETVTTDRQEIPPREDVTSNERDSETATDHTNKPGADITEDETYFLSKDVRAQQLLDLLQRDIGMANSSSSAVSSTSETSVKVATKSTQISKPGSDLNLFRREGPPGEASLPVQQTRTPERDLPADQSRTSSVDVSNITMGRRGAQPDDSTEELHRELLSEMKRHSSREGGSKVLQQKGPGQPLTPHPSGAFQGKPSVARTNVGGSAWTGPFSAGIERGHRDLWSAGTQTGMDGSYLSFLPQSQSTPGVFKATPKSAVKTKVALSAIESSCLSSTGVSSPQSAPDVPQPQEEEATSEKVKSLPSLNYMQKVDAWRANQSSGKSSLFDSLALQGFSGVSPKKRAYDAVSDSLNRILSQQARSQQQPPAAQRSTTAPPGSSSRRGEAVGSAPGDGDDAASLSGPSAGLHTRSSLSTVLSVKRGEQTERCAAEDQSQTEDRVQNQTLLVGLGQFSDVSPERDVMLSSSQDSYISGKKLGTSVGASSVVSLEVDNYAPYWTSKPPTPPPLQRPRDFNIEERIPLYLHNLGIDQSPSTILTPFAPRGPIREPEFSPTDLCTIKGSIGSPTKSTQPSEVSGGSPLKGEFSRSSILSVDSSMSIPFSMDSLGPAVSAPEETRRPSPEPSLIQSHCRLASSPPPDEDSYPSTLLTTLHQQRDSSVTSSQNTIQLADRFGSSLSLATDSKGEDGEDLGSPLRTSRSAEQSGEVSFVSTKALYEIRKLLSQAENVVSAGSSSASSPSSAARRHLSDENVGDPKTRPSLTWVRSASDSMLSSEKVREGSIGRESVASSGQRKHPSTPPLLSTAAAHSRPEDGTSRRAAESFVLSKSALRAEPEGCSAAPPDNTAPPPPQQPPDPSTPPSTDTAGITEDKETTTENLVQSGFTSPEPEDADQGAMSDGSSDSSLAIRVAKLLQSESSATMVSSSASATDQEESKAKEWIKLKVSGQQCEPRELDKEDRIRIEEIKNELLFKNPLKSQGSTDTESSAASSLRVLKVQGPVQQVETFCALVGNEPDHSLQGPRSDLPDSRVPLQNPPPPPPPDLEAQVHEIATKEGVTLPRSNLQPLTSITIATRRRSSSSSPPSSPSPHRTPPRLLHLSELSTEGGEQLKDDEKTATEAASSRHVTPPPPPPRAAPQAPPQAPDQRRQEAVGGQSEEPSAAPQTSLVSGVDREVDQATASSPRASPARTGHVSHIHITLSPKTTSPVPSLHTDAVQEQREFAPLRNLSSAASSPDEGVGLSSPPEWCEQRGPEGADVSTHCRTAATFQGRMTLNHRPPVSPRPLNAESAALPVLLPYKPRGSEELFYVPQTEADDSSTDTTMESTHTDSDDAVPPRFSSEVLGHQDPGLDRGVTIRHTEGIYSKRLKTGTFKMHEPTHRDETSQTNVTPPPKISVPVTRVPLSSPQEVSKRDQGTSPVQFLGLDEPGSAIAFQPLRVELDYNKISHRWDRSSAPETGLERDPAPPQLSRSSLDQLWQRFCTQWSPEESRPTGDRAASLLERLERLSRLIHGSEAADMSEDFGGPVKTTQKSEDAAAAAAKQRRRRLDAGLPGPRQAWTQTHQRKDEDSVSSCFSQDSFQSREGSETLSTATGSVSGSMSTVDTARLIRAFGAHRVQRLKTSSSLSKLYDAIDRQKDGREQRDQCSLLENSATDGSVVADSSSSTTTYTPQTRPGPSRTLAAKKTVKLVNKGVQAGDLELVWNGTRHHTRDVGTTFPSPRESRTSRRASSSSSTLEKGGRGLRSPSKPQGVQKHRKSKKSPPKSYPVGVSWFISADELRSEARKENRPEEEESTWRPSSAWFEPYSRVKPWREPLRARQVPEDGNETPGLRPRTGPGSGSRTKTGPSLQEALVWRRPEFISQSMQRVKRLALQVEERKLQEVFSRERRELLHGPGRAGRLLRPEGTAQLRRAVPRKEMIQRSKQIYENLPEVQRRREEERRRAEYRSYRLNARLYNKKVTSRVLGRRTMVQ
ncbi:uncharacterized protein V6R79_001041 [Siganus canaliculatus]